MLRRLNCAPSARLGMALAAGAVLALGAGAAYAADAAVQVSAALPPSPVSTAVTAVPGTPDGVSAGDTAWMLISAALVMFMMPGLALFYAGMVRRKNVLGTMMHSMAVLGIIGLEWVILGYAMAFGQKGNMLVGWDSNLLFLKGVMPVWAADHKSTLDLVHSGTHIPELVFIMFQGMFAIITPALITGAVAERVKFSAYALFMIAWSIVVYNPLAHWVWGGGWLGMNPTPGTPGMYIGALDFAGGTVVHISAGASALVMALYLGKRLGYPNHVLQPNSLVLTFLGAGMLWFGWFGFNGGSAVACNGLAGLAFGTTMIAAAAGAMGWMVAEWIKHGRATTLGVASGLVAGLVAITPASGYVAPWSAIIIGLAAGLVCYTAVLLKGKFGYDDSLDAFGVHGVGGFLGALLTGVFCQAVFNTAGGADGAINGNYAQVTSQLIAALTAAAYGAVGTLVLVFVIDKLVGFRLSQKHEIEGLDAAQHGEQGWMLDAVPVPMVSLPGDASVDMTPARERAAMSGAH